MQGGWFPLIVFFLASPAWCAKECGEISVKGYDNPVQVITTEWNTPGESAGNVFVKNGQVVPHMSGRSYFGDACTLGKFDNSEYVAFKLLNRRFKYTINLKGALCGCNTALYLTSLHQNTNVSKCSDYYCDANAVCGVRCAEIDIQESNQEAWHSTLHTAADGIGVGGGYGGGGDGWSGPRDWSQEEYGPGGTCINTEKPFQVEAAFPTDAEGKLRSMDLTLSQKGGKHSLSVSIDKYGVNSTQNMQELTDALEEGMTPIISYWKASNMLWLDGEGTDGKGPCLSDKTMFDKCSDSVVFYDFSISEFHSLPVFALPCFFVVAASSTLLVWLTYNSKRRLKKEGYELQSKLNAT